jgi:hypothetical protein
MTERDMEEPMTVRESKIEFALLFLLGFVLGLVLLANDTLAQ